QARLTNALSKVAGASELSPPVLRTGHTPPLTVPTRIQTVARFFLGPLLTATSLFVLIAALQLSAAGLDPAKWAAEAREVEAFIIWLPVAVLFFAAAKAWFLLIRMAKRRGAQHTEKLFDRLLS